MVCSKMKDKIWQKARDKKHFIRDEIYWWQRERTLMGHAHILWVLLSAASIESFTRQLALRSNER